MSMRIAGGREIIPATGRLGAGGNPGTKRPGDGQYGVTPPYFLSHTITSAPAIEPAISPRA